MTESVRPEVMPGTPLVTRIALTTSGPMCSQSAMMRQMQLAIEKALDLKVDSWQVLRESISEYVSLRSLLNRGDGHGLEVVVNSGQDGPFRVEENEDGPACIYEVWLITWRGEPPWLNDRLAWLSLHGPILAALDDMLGDDWQLSWHAGQWDDHWCSMTAARKHRRMP